MIFLRAYSHVLVQKSGAIQNPADIDAVDESGVRLSNEVGKPLVGASRVNGVVQNHLGRRVEHPTADAVLPLDVLEQGEVGHVLVHGTQHDIGGIAIVEDVVVLCAELLEVCELIHFFSPFARFRRCFMSILYHFFFVLSNVFNMFF